MAVLVAALAGASLAWFNGHLAVGQPSAATGPGQARPSAPPLTASQAASLLTHLTSGNRAAVTSAIAMSGGQRVPAATVRGLARLAPVSADIRSFRELSPSLATLTAADRTGTRWLLRLAWVSGRWLILDSLKQ